MGKDMATATLTSKGQITIPQTVRRRLGLKTGDRVDFLLEAGGRVVLKSHRIPFEELRGIVKIAKRKPVGIPEMDKAIGEAVADRFQRAARRTGTAK
jgi:AbrB family looped-hinge helix DNA binding protein